MRFRFGNSTHTMQLAMHGKHFFANYGHLFFSVFYFFPLIRSFDSYTQTEVSIQVLAYLGFVYLYRKALHCPAKDVLGLIALMAAICIFVTTLTPGTSTLFGYIGYFLGFCFIGPARWLMLLLQMMMITVVTVLFIDPHGWPYFVGPALVVSLGLFSFGVVEYKDRIHSNETRKNKEQIQQLAKIAERERIARDLHDLLGHSLSSISLKSELAGKFMAAGMLEKAQDETQEVAMLARTALSEVREAVSGMKQLGLAAQLEVMASRLQDKGVQVHKVVECGPVTAEKESCFCFVAKEAITNVIKHSSAKHMHISLKGERNYHILTFQDDGVVGDVVWGNGLLGIKSRVEELGGSMKWSTKHGCKLVAKLPI